MNTRSTKAWIYLEDWGWTEASHHFAKWLSTARRGLSPLDCGTLGRIDVVNNLVDPVTRAEYHISIERDSAGVITRQQISRHDSLGTYWDIRDGFERPTIPGSMGFRVHALERD